MLSGGRRTFEGESLAVLGLGHGPGSFARLPLALEGVGLGRAPLTG